MQPCTGAKIHIFLWCLTAWVKIEGANSALIRASLKTENTMYNCIGTVLAKNGCWSFLKGGFLLDSSSNLSLLFFQVYHVVRNVSLEHDHESNINQHILFKGLYLKMF